MSSKSPPGAGHRSIVRRQESEPNSITAFQPCPTAPATHSAIVLAFEGDEIDRAVHAHPEGLTMIRHFKAQGEPLGTVYVSDTPPAVNQP